MNDEREKSAPIDLETLLPWSLNGSLSEIEQARVRRALEQGHLPEQCLEETIDAYELATERPDSATLTALAAGDLSAREAEAVEAYLRRPGAEQDRELVDLARIAMSAEEPAGAPVASVQGGGSFVWRAWAVAASLMAVLMAVGWWAAARDTPSPVMAVAEVVELLPDDLVLRGVGEDATGVEVGSAGLTMVLIVDKPVGDTLSVSLRDGTNVEIARIDSVELRLDRSIHLHIGPEVAHRARRVILEEGVGEASRPIHEYSFEPTP